MNYLPICIQIPVNISKLYDELLKQNLIQPLQPNGTSTVYGTEEAVTIYVHPDITQEELDAIGEVMEAHDPTPIPEPPSKLERLEQRMTQTEADNLTSLEGIAEAYEKALLLEVENTQLKERLVVAEADNLTALEGTATVYEELLALKEQIKGGAA